MKITDIFNTKVIKRVSIFLSEQNLEIIIVPLFQDGKNGIIYNQGEYEIIPFNSSTETIGELVLKNFNLFKLTNYKKNRGNGSVLNVSKEKSKTAFDKKYTHIMISGANEYNIILNIETMLNHLSKLEICSSISASCENSELGKRILKIYNSEIHDRKK